MSLSTNPAVVDLARLTNESATKISGFIKADLKRKERKARDLAAAAAAATDSRNADEQQYLQSEWGEMEVDVAGVYNDSDANIEMSSTATDAQSGDNIMVSQFQLFSSKKN